MKSSVLALLALALGASAYRIEYGENGSYTVYSDPKAPVTQPAHKRLAARSGSCSPCRDKCVRAVVSVSKATPDFCASFLAETYTATEAFAPVQTQCADSADRVSAACSCFVQPTPSSSTPAEPSTEAPQSTEPSSTEPASTEPSSTEPSSTEVPTPSPEPCHKPGELCTLSNFIDVCCTIDGLPDGNKGCRFPTGDPNAGFCM
ncbi:hypothetical protein C8A05DRAFT_37236 [Staphylotrichum tortipilum]|uniref:Uncharacterized protein n=1 Tax=Staphylotrichum tortipilum TaxID=2831512 RepID=A0AAN6RQ01_9PEZI|nr:hypothetical protein C8A05DRAFT_37236 [Staphylotrichum longicolle]